jgi:hypothetical protein
MRKIVLGVAILIAIVAIAAYLFLFIDNPYPEIQTEGLARVDSKDLVFAKAPGSLVGEGSKNITTRGVWFIDPTGRTMILHGINVGGSSKVPYSPRMASHIKENFYESAYTVSFTGRPFPLNEADEHFARLNKWGYRFLRLLVTWEAIEHAGPGQYDDDYLNYVQALVKKAAEYDLNVFIDPHQDMWSRFTGGDGAPYWTLEKVGFDPQKFSETGAAILHNIEGDPFPRMIWPTNMYKLGSATMFTLFFAGNDFAPALRIDTASAQDFLQSHYIGAIKQLALRLKGMPNVIGFDTFNEPSMGFISYTNLDSLGLLKNGVMPTPFQGMVAGAGNTVEVDQFEFALTGSKLIGKVQLNPGKASAWKDPAADIWRNSGVWGLDAKQIPVILKTDYFTVRNGRKVNFPQDYLRPFVSNYTKAIREIDSSWVVFAEPALLSTLPEFPAGESTLFVHASHWYDIVTLLTKEYSAWFGVNVMTSRPVFGKRAIRETFHEQMAHKKAETSKSMGGCPTLVGEFGIPIDMQEGSSYKTNDFSRQETALDRSFRAMESNLLSYTLWNYTPDNDNAHGDQWNGEDLSIFSISQRMNAKDINSGGRALGAAIRPYPYKISGEPKEFFFNMGQKTFYLKFTSDPSIAAPTEIFVPEFQYRKGFEVFTTPGTLAFDQIRSLLLFTAAGGGEQTLLIKVKK